MKILFFIDHNISFNLFINVIVVMCNIDKHLLLAPKSNFMCFYLELQVGFSLKGGGGTLPRVTLIQQTRYCQQVQNCPVYTIYGQLQYTINKSLNKSRISVCWANLQRVGTVIVDVCSEMFKVTNETRRDEFSVATLFQNCYDCFVQIEDIIISLYFKIALMCFTCIRERVFAIKYIYHIEVHTESVTLLYRFSPDFYSN